MTSSDMLVPFLDLSGEFKSLQREWLSKISEAGMRGSFILGPELTALEHEFADYLGVRHAIMVANGTDALVLSLRALGIGPGHEVITTPYSFFASSEAISLVGAKPVFVDIDAGNFTISPQLISQAVTARTKAILPVHIFGQACDMTAIMRIAQQHKLTVIEDCAQAFAAMSSSRYVGTHGDCGCFSFYPTKVLGCYGDGGMVTTNDDILNEHIRRLRNHGASAAYIHTEIGYNSRLDEIQAALLRLKLRHIDQQIAARRKIAASYAAGLESMALSLPQSPPAQTHVYNVYTIRMKNRDAVRQAMTAAGISSALYYPLGLHLQPVYQALGYQPGSMPVCERITAENLSLPIYPGMPENHVDRVCEVMENTAASRHH